MKYFGLWKHDDVMVRHARDSEKIQGAQSYANKRSQIFSLTQQIAILGRAAPSA
jgi:hypothetical protein